MEIEHEVTSFHVEMQCDTCKKGNMLPAPFTETMALWKTTSYVGEPDFVHICNNADCGVRVNYPNKYPLVRYKYKDAKA